MCNLKLLYAEWLLVLHNQGIIVFDQSMSLLHAKAVACISRVEIEPPEFTLHAMNHNATIIDLDESEESEDNETGAMNNDGGRKRKEPLSSLEEPQVKQVKLNHIGSGAGDNFISLSSGGSDSDGFSKNVASDDDMDLAG